MGRFALGFVEGFYGRPWSWADRRAQAEFLAEAGYGFYIYAPKADAFLRKRWREPMPDETLANLRSLAGHLAALGIEFGVGLSPYEVYRSFDDADRAALGAKIDALRECGVVHLAVLFDDMRGDLQGLAQRQADILHWIADRSGFSRLSMCPTYYSDDPVLDRIFGERPRGYLRDLGHALDSSIETYWTGEQICSVGYTVEHLSRVTDELGRKPLLWDNYPVNDGQKMCGYLHLRSVTGRPSALGDRLSGHAVNPMNQAYLSRIPALTLVESYRRGSAYDPHVALSSAALSVLGMPLSARVVSDIARFQDEGLPGMSAEARLALRRDYAAFDHPAAREIVDWLDGRYEVTRELVLTQ